MEIAISILAGVVTVVVMTCLVAYVAFKAINKRLIEPKRVFEEPGKEKIILVPGKGVFGIADKRKPKFIDETRIAVEEENQREKNLQAMQDLRY